MIRYKSHFNRIMEAVECPSLQWKSEGENIIGAEVEKNGEPCYFTLEGDVPYIECEILGIVVAVNAPDIEDGKNVCEDLWNALCIVSKYCDLDKHIVKAIAKKYGWFVAVG